jgi:hypothetical protein
MNAASGRLAVVWWRTPPFRNGQPTWGGFPCLPPGIGWPRPATACRRPEVHIISYMYFCTFVNQFYVFFVLQEGVERRRSSKKRPKSIDRRENYLRGDSEESEKKDHGAISTDHGKQVAQGLSRPEQPDVVIPIGAAV